MKNSGIYKITNIINNKCYIGSTKNLKAREKQHFNLLRRNKNHSKLLQRAFNKYKENNFIFEVLEYCSVEQLFTREQYFVDNLKPQYNICINDVRVPININRTYDIDKLKEDAFKKLSNNDNFGWKSRKILKLDDQGNIIKEYNSLKEYAFEHNCAIGNVGKALKKGNRCKGFYVKYKE